MYQNAFISCVCSAHLFFMITPLTETYDSRQPCCHACEVTLKQTANINSYEYEKYSNITEVVLYEMTGYSYR